MQTQCPDCSTIFRVDAVQLGAAEGLVRCGQCGNVFNASAALLERPEPEAERQEHLDLSFKTLAEERPRARFLLREMGAQQEVSAPAPSRRFWLPLNLVLGALLVAQLVYGQREALAEVPGLRGAMLGMCHLLGCELRPRRDLARIELLNRNVYSHPNVPDGLIISATMVNNASFVQPFPVLGVSMANVRGVTLVQRDFRPQDYLPALDAGAGMTPGAPVSVALQVVDPGSAVMTFELDFH